MNPVLAGIALVLLVVFAALAFSRKRREQQNWRLLAGLAAVFAVALVASLLLPPFEPPPPPLNGGQPAPSGPVVVELEGVLRTPLAACGDDFCFGIDVLRVVSGPKTLEGEKNLNVTTDKEIVLLGGKIVRVYGERAGGYGVLAPASNIKYVESDGSLSAPETVQPEAQPAEVPIGVSFTGYPLGEWERCGTKWCNTLRTFEIPASNGLVPSELLVESDSNPGDASAYIVFGVLSGGKVSAEQIEVTWGGE